MLFYVTEHGALIQHIEEFISNQISEVVEELSNVANAEKLKEAVAIAKKLKESITTVEVLVSEATAPVEEAKADQANLAQKLQDALLTLQTEVIDSAQEIAPTISSDALQRVSEVVTYLQEDLREAIIYIPEKIITAPGMFNIYLVPLYIKFDGPVGQVGSNPILGQGIDSHSNERIDRANICVHEHWTLLLSSLLAVQYLFKYDYQLFAQ